MKLLPVIWFARTLRCKSRQSSFFLIHLISVNLLGLADLKLLQEIMMFC